MNNAICKQCGANTHLPAGATPEDSLCSWCGESLAPAVAPAAVAAAPAAAPPAPPAADSTAAGTNAPPPATVIDHCERCSAPIALGTGGTGSTGMLCDRCGGGAQPRPSQVCARCGDLISPPAGGGRPGAYCERCQPAITLAERNLRWESEFRFLGAYTLISSIFGMVVAIPMGLWFALAGGGGGMGGLEALIVVGVVTVFCGAFAYGGLALFRLRNWARVTAGVLAVLCTIASLTTIIGAIFYGVIAWMLLGEQGARLTTPEYRQLIAQDPHRKRPFSILLMIFLGYLALMAVVFVVLLVVASM